MSPPLVAFDQGQALQARVPTSETVAVDCAAHTLSHSMTTMVGTKDGPVPADLNLHVGTGAGFDLAVTKDGFKTRYIAGGTLLGRTRTPRYLILDVGGSFGTGDTYAAASGLPKNGSFSLHIVLDCSDNSVTSESLVLRGN
ncbi:MAG TPA: hypothetical protein VFS18_03165 [Actinomycetota bacterium]|nr:hypothetical protein [Actinomycetota bacterium]